MLPHGQRLQHDTNASASSTEDTLYQVRVVMDGANITVERAAPGEVFSEVLSTTSANDTTTSYIQFVVTNGSSFTIDDIRLGQHLWGRSP